jgi:hypothetical protein
VRAESPVPRTRRLRGLLLSSVGALIVGVLFRQFQLDANLQALQVRLSAAAASSRDLRSMAARTHACALGDRNLLAKCAS